MQEWKQALLRNERRVGWFIFAFAPVCWALVLLLGEHPKHWLWPLPFSVGAFVLLQVWCRSQRQAMLREVPLPQLLKRRLRERYPLLSGKDCDLVERGLRQFFLACLRSRGKFVAMPSRVVDSMWQGFAAQDAAYRDWCMLAFGDALPYAPAEALGHKERHNDGLRRAWYWACRDEVINPKEPSRLPLLFALDSKLKIENGFRYLAQRDDAPGYGKTAADAGDVLYFGSDFSDGAFSGDADHFGGAAGSDASGDAGGDSDSGADGGGDGGD